MAESASSTLRRLEEQLTCPVCLDLYKNPKALSCQHNFCLDCLAHCPRETKEGARFLKCPSCRNLTQLPEGNPSKLPSAFTTNALLELHGEMVTKRNVTDCPRHQKPLEAFCESCQELVCFYCATRSHGSHCVRMIADIIGDRKKEVESDLEQAKKRVAALMDVAKAMNTCDESLVRHGNVVKQQIRSRVQEARDVLDEAESHLVAEVMTAIQRKREIITLQKKEVLDIVAQLQTTIKVAEQSFRVQSPQQIIASIEMTGDFVRLSLSDVLNLKFKPLEKADLELKLNPKLVEECSMIGTLHYSLLSQKCHLVPQPVTLGKVAVFQLSVQESDGSAMHVSKGLISCQVTATNGPQPEDCTIKNTAPGKYDVIFSPIIRGPHHLKVTVGGIDIPGSVFSIPVLSSSEESRGQPLHTMEGLKKPTSIAFGKENQVIVSEGGDHCITIFSADFQEWRSIGSFGSRVNEFNGPTSVAVTVDDHILVADSGNDRIQVLSMQGQFLQRIKSEGDLNFTSPLCVAIHSSGQILFSERSTNRIHVLNCDLTFSHTFPTRGSKRGVGEGHPGIAVDSQGAIYIADYRNSFIQKYSISGQFLAAIGTGGQLFGLFGIVVDNSNHIYVSEGGNHRISKFTTKGKLVMSFKMPGGDGTERPSVALNALAMDKHGNLYMSDPFRNCVTIF